MSYYNHTLCSKSHNQSSAHKVEIRSMKMELEQPPWANELLARNRKVGRTICSTSDIHQGKTSFTFESSKGRDDDHESTGSSGQGRKRTEDNKVTHPSSQASQVTRGVLPTGSSLHDDVFYDSALCQDQDMRQTAAWTPYNSSGEESILEYGPGIVSKLRSKYQSLAARQPTVRPSLHRSTSLEHSLDFVQHPASPQHQHPASPQHLREEVLSPTLPSGDTLVTKSTESDVTITGMMTLNVRPTYNKVVNNTNTLHIRPISRGRQGAGQIEQQNRMRRARSVDSLQHNVEYTRQEEEILEKLKTVVLPKEEVVIIEMSKPRLNLGNLKENEFKYNNNAINSLISPDHELPPHFIVRDTARKFETNPGGYQQWKKVGHVLKACKSPSISPTESARSSPLPSPIITSAEKKIQVVPAQPQQRPSSLIVTTESSTPKNMNSFYTIKPGTETGTSTGTGVGISVQTGSPGKQVGVIRPTVNGVQKSSSGPNLAKPSSLPPRRETPSPSTNQNKVFQFIQPPTKPPLGPKPYLASKMKQSSAEAEKVPKISIPNEPTSAISGEIQRPSDLNLNLSVRTTSPSRRSPSPRSPSPASSQSSSSISDVGSDPVATKNADTSPVKLQNAEPFPVKLKPVGATTTQKGKEAVQKCSNLKKTNETGQTSLISSESQTNSVQNQKQPYNDTVTSSITSNNNFSSLLKQNAREGDALKKPKSVEDDKSSPAVSQLRTHQKQKSQQSGGSMVFNFTNRQKVPDYIEDDGLHLTSRGRGNDEVAEDSVDGYERIDPKLIQFIGANVIINGKSSIQKKPKSQKMSISFNEEGTTTFEYPSEASVWFDEVEVSVSSGSNNNLVTDSSGGLKNVSGNGLSNYTPSKVVPNNYQLGFYRENIVSDANSNKNKLGLKAGDANKEVAEDYLKPDTESTTWSNEIGAADILF